MFLPSRDRQFNFEGYINSYKEYENQNNNNVISSCLGFYGNRLPR